MCTIVGEICGHCSLSNFIVGLSDIIIVINVLRIGSACSCLSVSDESRTCTDRASGPVVAGGL